MDLENTALLVLGHGSSKHPDSSASVRMHTELLRERGGFAEVHCAFLKEPPLLEHALDKIDAAHVCIVPDFLAEGYFTRQVIPAKLDLLAQGKRVCYAPPVGTHPLMAELIRESAADVAGEWELGNTSLLVIGHGSGKNPCSKQTLKSHLHDVLANSCWGQVADLWLEEAPRVENWCDVAVCRQVVILPFLLNDGQHGGWDIPAELGIGKGAAVHGVTHRLMGREVRIAPALGTSPKFASAIAEIAKIWSAPV